ncbi:TPA: retron St85 family effector protein [Vibrio fluvialis]|nr:retron St85 family effector protein [Vibrio fluvialis]HCG5682351.1 retron St85 family effector protein [Vibrio parahaemolyticus]
MKVSFNENHLRKVVDVIKDKVFVPLTAKKTTIFLCGGAIDDDNYARSKMSRVFREHSKYELLFPEDIFDDLLAGPGQHSLLHLENILADCVDAIVLFPESPGSFAEIGAFSNNSKLAEKLIVISDKNYKNKKSFINYGPYRLIKATQTGKVLHVNYKDLDDNLLAKKLYRTINENVTKIKKQHPVQKNVANILEVEHFILPCIYLLDDINFLSLTKLISFATQENTKFCEIAIKSSLGRLAHKRLISRTPDGYDVTPSGADYVRRTFNNTALDRIRLEVLNAENRRNSTIKSVRMQ